MAVWVPKAGALIELRGAIHRVLEVEASPADPRRPAQHWVKAEALQPGRPKLSVLWQHEVNARVLDNDLLPEVQHLDQQKPIPWPLFRAYLLAQRWAAENQGLQAPLKTGLKLAGYQLVPLAHALKRPRVNLLIADDVGLGKTIEAGLIIQELISLKRIRRTLIVSPASLCQQWKSELKHHFNLDFEVIDRRCIDRLRRRHRSKLNPWQPNPMAIVSMDLLKREDLLEDFLDAAKHGPSWDMLLVDEAHRLTASDSDRARMARKICPLFEHRLFLTATPHQGQSKQFHALLALLDPERFPPHQKPSPRDIRHVMLRRRKHDTERPPELKAPKRSVSFLPWTPDHAETKVHKTLDRYLEALLQEDHAPKAAALIACSLKKRLLSSLRAFQQSLDTHCQALKQRQKPSDETGDQNQLVLDKAWLDDDQKHREEHHMIALSSARLKHRLSARTQRRLRSLQRATNACQHSRKTQALLAWLEHKDHRDHKVIIFTEFRDTLRHLADALAHIPNSQIRGGMPQGQRRQAIADFSRPDGARLLLATDAACEGLNLQHACARLIHYEVPWNPCRMEQRNGRIDRIGQNQPTVHCLHFLGHKQRDEHYLQTLVTKVNRVRRDLGPIGRVVAKRVEQALVANKKTPEPLIREGQKQRRSCQMAYKRQARRLLKKVQKTRSKLQCSPADLRLVIDQALALEDASPLTRDGRAWKLQQIPKSWRRPAQPASDLTPQTRWTDIPETTRKTRPASPNQHESKPGRPDVNSKLAARLKKSADNAPDPRPQPQEDPGAHLLPANKQRRALHLNAAIVQRAIESLSSLEHPVTAIPCPGQQHQLVVFVRLSWINRQGATIHEQDKTLWAVMEGQRLRWRRSSRCPQWARLNQQRTRTRPLPPHRELHQHQLKNKLEAIQRREKSRARRLLARVARKRLRHQRRLINKRLGEVQSLIELHTEDCQQHTLWPPSQWLLQGTELWELERCREDLLEERRNAPKILKSRLQLDPKLGIRARAYAILYGIPNAR